MSDPSVPARLLELAIRAARGLHHQYSTNGTHGSINGDCATFEHCPHPDCLLVREAAKPMSYKDYGVYAPEVERDLSENYTSDPIVREAVPSPQEQENTRDVSTRVDGERLADQPLTAASDWRLIETAPKVDGHLVLLYPSRCWAEDVNSDCEVGYWDVWLRRWNGAGTRAEDYSGPTHWMPLPDPPSEGREAVPSPQEWTEGTPCPTCGCGTRCDFPPAAKETIALLREDLLCAQRLSDEHEAAESQAIRKLQALEAQYT